jgi:hypothetical protein
MKTLKSQPNYIPILLEGLRSSIVEINFNKKDGLKRVMNATLRQDLIPSESLPKGEGVAVVEEEPTFVRVFDVDALGWRTIIFDSVNSFSPA